MAESIVVPKRRGRPKKVIEEEAFEKELILVIDESGKASTYAHPTKSGKTTGKKSAAETIEDEAKPKKRTSRKAAIKDDAVVGTKRAARTKKTAKSMEKVTSPGLENIVEAPAPASELSGKTILEQASVFKDTRISEADKSQTGSATGQSLATEIAAISSSATDITKTDNRTYPEEALRSVQSALRELTEDIHRSRIERTELSLLRRVNETKHSRDSIEKIKLARDQRLRLATRIQYLLEQSKGLQTSVRQSSDRVQSLRRTRLEQLRLQRLHTAAVQIAEFETGIQQSAAQVNQFSATQAAATQARERSRVLQALQLQTDTLTDHIQQSRTAAQNLAPAQPTHKPSTTPPGMTLANMSSRHQTQPSSTPQSASTQPSTSTSHTRTTQQPRPTNPPPSTRTPSNPTPKHPSRLTPPPQTHPQPHLQFPTPPRPTQQPYDTLRHTPEFKRQSRMWLSLMVGIPVLVTTTWVLYKRYQDTLAKRQVGLRDGAARGIGVGRGSDVGVNGGV